MITQPMTYLKAIYGAVLAFLSALATVLVGDVSFGDIQSSQWLTAALAALVSFGGIFGVTNREPTVDTPTAMSGGTTGDL